MEKEFYRISTFSSWPENSMVGALKLARLGYFYRGVDDEVECSFCNARLSVCRAFENPEERCKLHSPNCEFVNRNCPNRPFALIYDNQDFASETSRNTRFTSESLSRIRNVYQSASKRAVPKNIFSAGCSLIDRCVPDYDQLRREEVRLSTFFDWPEWAHVNMLSLAREGFFYAGTDDNVQCVFCRGFLKNWKLVDIPSVEHSRHFPDCPFVRGLDVGNVPVVGQSTNENDGRNGNPCGVESSNLRDEEISESMKNKFLIQDDITKFPCSEPPKFPEFSDVSHRVQSFLRGRVSPGQTAENLADAGWFFIGPGDKVQCFQCGGNLREWEPEDDPWEEHKRWYGNCQFVKTHRPAPRPRLPQMPEPVHRMTAVTAPNFHIEPREVKARMDTPMVRAILDMGYSKELIRTAIEKQLSMSGDDFSSAESILETLFQLEEDSANPPNPSAPGLSSMVVPSGATSASSSSAMLSKEGSSNLVAASMLTSEAASVERPEGDTELNLKTKGKRKRNKKKKSSSASNSQTNEEKQTDELQSNQNNIGSLNQLGEELKAEVTALDEEARQYVEENQRLREARQCKVCMDEEIDTVFLPCGHLVCCSTCSPLLRNCPICRNLIRGTVKTFLS